MSKGTSAGCGASGSEDAGHFPQCPGMGVTEEGLEAAGGAGVGTLGSHLGRAPRPYL